MQLNIFEEESSTGFRPLKGQLLKWVGNKRRYSSEIISYFPISFGKYYEPFLGSGAILAALSRPGSLGSDTFQSLIEIWDCLKSRPDDLKSWYRDRSARYNSGERKTEYERIKASYNESPNGPDLLFLSRSCYGGVVRFRQVDGYMSTPCGAHNPIPPHRFDRIVDDWHIRVSECDFAILDYDEAMRFAGKGDLIYCDPPYTHSQAILFGAQKFSLARLFEMIELCRDRGVYVALSIDGKKKSGEYVCDLPIPKGLFEREIFLDCGRSMLRRFQMVGQTLENEIVYDRLLLTY